MAESVEWQVDPGASATSETLEPGQSLTQTTTWDGTYTGGQGDDPPFYEYGSMTASIVDSSIVNALASASFQILSPIQDALTTNGSTFQVGQPIQFTFTRTNSTYFTVSVLGAPPITDFCFQSTAPLEYQLGVSGGTTGSNGVQSFGPGQTVTLAVTETNTGNLPVTILNAGDVFDIAIAPNDSIVIPVADIAPVGQVVTLQRGQSQTFTATWNPASDPTLPPSGCQTCAVFFDDISDPGGMFEDLSIEMPNPSGSNSSNPSDPPGTGSSASSSLSTAPAAQRPSNVPSPGPLTAAVSGSTETSQPGSPVSITLTLKNTTNSKVRVTPFASRAQITLLRGSTVVAMVRKRLSVAHARTLMPGRSLRLTTDLAVRPSRAELTALEPGTYTVEVQDGGSTATTAIRVGTNSSTRAAWISESLKARS
jgi:hypothetical protein